MYSSHKQNHIRRILISDAKWDGGAKIVMNATDILDAFMARANVHGNVPVNQAGEACFAIKVCCVNSPIIKSMSPVSTFT